MSRRKREGGMQDIEMIERLQFKRSGQINFLFFRLLCIDLKESNSKIPKNEGREENINVMI